MRKLLKYLLLLLPAIGTAQQFEGNLKIENITTPEGFQLAYVYDMAQDNTGLMWMRAGWDFYTYDGNKLSKVKQEVMGFPPPVTRRLYADNKDPLFYIVRDSLVVYDPVARKVVRVYVPGNIQSSPKPETLAGISLGDNNVLWALANSGANYKNTFVVRSSNGGPFTVVSPIKVSWYYDVTLARGSHFFVKLRDRVEEYDSTGRVKVYSFPTGPDPVMPSMVKDAENTIWVVHSPDKSKDQYGVYFLKEGQAEFTRLPAGNRFPQEEKHGQLFADGTFIWHRGYPFHLSRRRITDGTYEDFTDKIIEQSLQFPFYNSTLLNIIRDKSGELWISTRSGIVKITIEEDLFRKYGLEKPGKDCSDEKCQIKGMAEDEEGNIYLAHYDGITLLNPKTGRMTALPLNLPPQPQKVHALSYAQGTLFWNEYAIELTTYKTRKLFASSTYEYLAHGINPEGIRLWIGVNDSPFELYVYDILSRELINTKMPDAEQLTLNDEIRQIHFSPTTGTLFVATWFKGVLEVGVNGEVINRYETNKNPKLWPSNAMYCLYEDAEAQLWFGHGGEAGLGKMDLKTREITNFPYQINSFTGALKRVFQILPGKGNYLWLVTEKGTIRLDKKTGELARFPMFPTFSEMAFHLLPGFAAKNGTLYVGTPNGSLYAFDTETVNEKAGFEQVFPVVINRYERFDKQQDSLFTQLTNLNELSEIHLTHQDRYFSLEFFVPDYRNTSQNLYSYWLEGYDKDWSTPSNINQLQYENLPPGKYTLHIRGGLAPVYYDSSERIIKVFVSRAWYVTWWAYLFYTLAFGGLLLGIRRYEMRRQLMKAEALRLQELDTLKSRLYTNITHEFRTPLTVIMGMTDQLAVSSQQLPVSESEKQKMAGMFQLILRNSKNLLRLINQLLDLAKLDSGLLKLNLAQGDIINYVQYLSESFYSMAQEKKIRLTFYSEEKVLMMDFDEEKIQYIVYNLLSNAIKFTQPEGKVVLHLRQVEQNNEPWLQLKVSDTGAGISKEDLAHIFDRFYQADKSLTRQWEGTGIGLALTKELVEMMGGTISVESELGEGTTFLILFPVRKGGTTAVLEGSIDTSQPVAPKFLADTTASFVPITEVPVSEADDRESLLIIEDNPDVITYVESLLQKDFLINTARNGQAGIDMAFETVPDIIICDVMMPVKDGYEVCRTLKNDERTSHIPIILLTAKAATEDRMKGLREGADAYLTKPFNKEELFIRLEKLVELRRALQTKYSDWRLVTSDSGSQSLIANHQSPSNNLEDIFLQKLYKVVEDHFADYDFGVVQLCRAANLSNMQVNRKLKALTGKTPSLFIRSIRLQKGLDLLKTTQLTISEIAYEVGFSDPNYFTRSFSEEFGHPPSVMRN